MLPRLAVPARDVSRAPLRANGRPTEKLGVANNCSPTAGRRANAPVVCWRSHTAG
jgi:hypothetical protein